MKLTAITTLLLGLICYSSNTTVAAIQAGAAVVDVTPLQFPVFVNGGMTSRSESTVNTKVNARAIVLDDGDERLAIVVVDSCMMPRVLLDEAKQLASRRTKIEPDHMLICATHTHTAPASMGCLGTDADPTYVPYLREKLAEAIAAAEANLEPARVGWAAVDAPEYTALRRWILRSDRIGNDPFGNPTVRANMHAGRNWDVVTGESGPEDPELSLISIQSLDGRPLALLANFSMHYFGDGSISADYFGLFCTALQAHIAPHVTADQPAFVAALSHGCSGDIWRRDYTDPNSPPDAINAIGSYADGLARIALEAYDTIEYQDDADLAMAEARLDLDYRVPDQQRLEWSRRIVQAIGDRLPETTVEVYAREQVILHELQSTEVVVQALRIGDIGVATTPNETYALTGLKLKLQSPLSKTMVIELANGGDGYIPPPEQHELGGYNTWAARSAGLELAAEPKITAAALGLLERVAGRARRKHKQSHGAYSTAVMLAKPVAYWRLDELAGPRAVDSSVQGCDAFYESGVVFFLEGPCADLLVQGGETNRAAHFAGGRLRARVPELGDQYSISCWFWNGRPVDGRPVTGWMISRDRDYGLSAYGDHLGIGGTDGQPGKLVFLHGDSDDPAQLQTGRTEVGRWRWNQLVFVRNGDDVRVYLNGNPEPEIDITAPVELPTGFDQLFLGGRSDRSSNWEGRLDDIAVFDRALDADEIEFISPQ